MNPTLLARFATCPRLWGTFLKMQTPQTSSVWSQSRRVSSSCICNMLRTDIGDIGYPCGMAYNNKMKPDSYIILPEGQLWSLTLGCSWNNWHSTYYKVLYLHLANLAVLLGENSFASAIVNYMNFDDHPPIAPLLCPW